MKDLDTILLEVAQAEAAMGEVGIEAWKKLTAPEDVAQYEQYEAQRWRESELHRLMLDMAANLSAAIRQFVDAFVEAITPVLQKFVDVINAWWGNFVVGLRRVQFYVRLRRKRIPRWLSKPVARLWPRKWLPQVEYNLWL